MADVAQAWKFLENSDRIASTEEVEAAVRKVAVQLEARLAGSYPLVLAVMGGAVVFAGQILPMLRFPLDFDFVHASRCGNATSGQKIEWRVSPPGLAKGRSVLVLDDILDHGDTMRAIRDGLMELGAESFHCAVLVNKKLNIEKPLKADFVGLEIPDRFVFGCGMDAKGYWRNLPEIRAMKET